MKTCHHDKGYRGSAPDICSGCEAERARAASGPGSHHLSFSPASARPSLQCARCSQQAFILHHAQAPAPTLLECSCCGDVINLGLLQYMYPESGNPDVVAERERAAQVADAIKDSMAEAIADRIRSGK